MATTQQLTATVTMTDATTRDVTAETAWSSSDEAVATVSATGLVSAVATGPATVTGTYQGVSGTCSVTVAASPESLEVTPSTADLDEP